MEMFPEDASNVPDPLLSRFAVAVSSPKMVPVGIVNWTAPMVISSARVRSLLNASMDVKDEL